jgi:prefoldin subunit 5
VKRAIACLVVTLSLLLINRSPRAVLLSYSPYNTNDIAADFKQKIPEIEESLAVVKKLKTKQDQQEVLVTRYSLSDAGVFAKAEVDTDSGLVGLWLGANVMLEYTYEDAIELLISKEEKAKKEFEEVSTLLLRFDSHCCCLFGK